MQRPRTCTYSGCPSWFASFASTISYFQSQSLSSAGVSADREAAGNPRSFAGSVNQALTVVTGSPLSTGRDGFRSFAAFAAAYVLMFASDWMPPEVSFAVPSEAPAGAGVPPAIGFACTFIVWAAGSAGFTVAAVAPRVPASAEWASFSSPRRPTPGAG